eukprot:TRINITY_DN62541_c0_g1_i1.p1 TRINITY_DN62541_c0_g1~~TRINITY_DN62541_c0_g1_i1.p1  ORF type:complete len:467 (-),score=65.59 TRINITY_DN62541_c0_g1_i1:23-1399(-)
MERDMKPMQLNVDDLTPLAAKPGLARLLARAGTALTPAPTPTPPHADGPPTKPSLISSTPSRFKMESSASTATVVAAVADAMPNKFVEKPLDSASSTVLMTEDSTRFDGDITLPRGALRWKNFGSSDQTPIARQTISGPSIGIADCATQTDMDWPSDMEESSQLLLLSPRPKRSSGESLSPTSFLSASLNPSTWPTPNTWRCVNLPISSDDTPCLICPSNRQSEFSPRCFLNTDTAICEETWQGPSPRAYFGDEKDARIKQLEDELHVLRSCVDRLQTQCLQQESAHAKPADHGVPLSTTQERDRILELETQMKLLMNERDVALAGMAVATASTQAHIQDVVRLAEILQREDGPTDKDLQDLRRSFEALAKHCDETEADVATRETIRSFASRHDRDLAHKVTTLKAEIGAQTGTRSSRSASCMERLGRRLQLDAVELAGCHRRTSDLLTSMHRLSQLR